MILPLLLLLNLGQTTIPVLNNAVLGTWSWGNRLLYDYKQSDDEKIIASYIAAREAGVHLFDTGDSYGTGAYAGNAERLLSLGEQKYQQRPATTSSATIISKIAVYPTLLTTKSYYDNIVSSRSRLNIDSTNANFIPSIHWSPRSYFPFQTKTIYSALALAYNDGLCSGIGLSNLGGEELLLAADYFERKSVPIACNQIQTSLVSNIDIDVLPALRAASLVNVDTFGYSPLSLGLLADERTQRGFLRKTLFSAFEKEGTGGRDVLDALDAVASDAGKTKSQIALAYVAKRGLFPLFGARDPQRVRENVAGCNYALTDDEYETLERARKKLTRYSTRNIFMTQ